jgi:two-component system OmpR family sensor kinase
LHIISQAITKRSATSLEPIGEQSIPLEIKPMVQELNKLLVRLDISLQAQRRFTADAAHELRTPLTALQLQLANLRRAKSESERATHADKLQEGMDRAANVVRQLLVMARVEPDAAEHSMTDVDLGEVICDATMRFAQEAVAKNIDLGIPRIEPVVLHGSIENLRVLIENLIGNAIRYTPAGGKVNVSLYQEEGVALLEVQDNGIGIPQEDRLRIFERFYRVQGNDTEGAGLGLSIAKDVVEQHRGTIEVGDGLNGKGTTFRLRLPVS